MHKIKSGGSIANFLVKEKRFFYFFDENGEKVKNQLQAHIKCGILRQNQ